MVSLVSGVTPHGDIYPHPLYIGDKVRDDLSHPVHSDNCILNVRTGECDKVPPAYTWRDYRYGCTSVGVSVWVCQYGCTSVGVSVWVSVWVY